MSNQVHFLLAELMNNDVQMTDSKNVMPKVNKQLTTMMYADLT